MNFSGKCSRIVCFSCSAFVSKLKIFVQPGDAGPLRRGWSCLLLKSSGGCLKVAFKYELS